MNDGVKILLERMQTHPEEFYGAYNRWTEVIERFEKFFNASERAMINGALTNIRRNEFTQVIMQEILREPTPVEVDPNTYTINRIGTTAEQLRALRLMPNGYQQTPTLQEQVDRIRDEHPFEPFCGEVK
jgi:hypothetical protein